MPIVDTVYQKGDTDGGIGMLLDDNGESFRVEKSEDDALKVYWSDKSVILKKDRIILDNCNIKFTYHMNNTKISTDSTTIYYEYKGNKYALCTEGATVTHEDGTVAITGAHVTLIPTRS